MSNDRKYLKKDHIITIEIPGKGVVESDVLLREDAHELFSWLNSYFDTIRITITQLIPIEYERRELWVKDIGVSATERVNEPWGESE